MSNQDSKTNGRRKAHVDRLADQVRDCIDAAYAHHCAASREANGTPHSDDSRVLRDFARNQTFTDAFENLVREESANERQHRKGAPNGFRYPISAQQAALVVLLYQFGQGTELDAMPPASYVLAVRHSAAIANIIGYLSKGEIGKREGLREALEALDYAQAVRS